MRRKPGTLLDLEAEILAASIERSDEVHGFALAKRIADRTGSQRLTSHGTLYKALGRLEDGGLLESRWEDPAIAEGEGRPRRRLYRITAAGQAALTAHVTRVAPPLGRIGGVEPA